MRKFFKTIPVFVLSLFLMAGAAFGANYDYWAQVYRSTPTVFGTMSLTPVSSGVQFVVFTSGTTTAATITKYGDDASTSVTNPVTAANFASATVCAGQVKFRSTASTVDVLVTDNAGGYSAFADGMTVNDHRIVIDESTNAVKHGAVYYSATTTAETSTGVQFDYDTAIHDVRLQVIGTAAGATMSVGLLSSETSGDADGFLALRSVATAGYVKDTGVVTGGTTYDYTPATTYGALLYTAITGVDSTAAGGGRSYLGHIISSANARTLTYSSSTTATTTGLIHYWFSRLK